MATPELVLLQPFLLPDTIIDQRYATANNITGKVLYQPGENPPQLARVPAFQLIKATKEFRAKGYNFVFYDGLRTQYAQDELIKACDDPDYVDPNSGHLVGASVDGTIAFKNTNKLVDMGTLFDEFVKKSHLNAEGLTPLQQMNRVLFAGVMAQCGFKQHLKEWWHFDYVGSDVRGVLNRSDS